MKTFDAIFIGTGQSGPFLAKQMAKKGWKVAIIEKGKFGGSCVNVGCTPTKTLIANAKVAYFIKNSKFYGIHVPRYKIDYKAVKARKDQIVRSGSHGVKKSLLDTPGCTVFEGQARFVGKNRVQVGKEILEADKIFINVGAEPHIPAIPGLDKIAYLTNATLLDVTSLPKHLIILGGGYIGIEFAQMFRRFGSKVTIIHSRERVMNKEDPDISEALQKILKKEKVDIFLNAKDLSFKMVGKKIVAKVGKKKIAGTHLLVATGRIPATADLGLEKAGIKTDKKGNIQVDDQLKTANPHVWALGDCNGKGAFTHTSYNDYEITAANLLENGNRKVSYRHPIYALYSDPPLGRVGMTEKEAKEKFPNVLMAKIPMTWVSRAKEQGETDGLLKILVDGKTKQILGASFLGFHCDEVVQLVSVVMQAKLPYTIIQETVGIHPTVSELLPTLMENLKPI